MALFSCNHNWGFPRRKTEFEGKCDVDVQTCSKCGAQRISPVQFGPTTDATEAEQLLEARA